MFQHGNSIGALRCPCWHVAGGGWKRWRTPSPGWGAILAGRSTPICGSGPDAGFRVAFIVGIERPLYPRDVEPADHTHAFDTYCQPFLAGYSAAEQLRGRNRGANSSGETQPHELHRLPRRPLAGSGRSSRRCTESLDPTERVEAWLARNRRVMRPAPKARPMGYRASGPVLAVVVLGCHCGVQHHGLLAYYPAPDRVRSRSCGSPIPEAMDGLDDPGMHGHRGALDPAVPEVEPPASGRDLHLRYGGVVRDYAADEGKPDLP